MSAPITIARVLPGTRFTRRCPYLSTQQPGGRRGDCGSRRGPAGAAQIPALPERRGARGGSDRAAVGPGPSGKQFLTGGDPWERMTGIEPALSAWEAGEPTSQVVFQAQTWPFGAWLVAFRRVGAREGPEQLIKMATGQLPELPAAANGDTCGDKQRLGLSRLSRLGANAASRVLRSAYAEWTVNLFCSAKSSDPFHPWLMYLDRPFGCATCAGRAR